MLMSGFWESVGHGVVGSVPTQLAGWGVSVGTRHGIGLLDDEDREWIESR